MDRNRDRLFNNLYDRTAAGMMRYAKASFGDEHLAEDIVQETFLVVLTTLEDVVAKPNPESWAWGIFKNIVKRTRTERYKISKRLMSIDDVNTDALQVIDELSPDISLGGVIADEDFTVLKKLYLEGYTYKDLANDYGISESAIGMRVSRAKEKFRNKLK